MTSYRDSNRLILSLLLLALWPANGFSQQPQTKRPLTENEDPLLIGKRNINKQQINFYSTEKEIALGRQLAAEIEQQSRLVDDAGVTDYLAKLGRNLALHSDSAIPVTIKLVDSEEVSAAALPGGFLYVNLGLMRAVETESELAAVIAHLIAHVAARHGIEFGSKTELSGITAFRQVIFTEKQYGGLSASQDRFSITVLAFRRKAEAEADALGAQYAWAAGYDSAGLIKFYEKNSQSTMSSARIFSPHPLLSERISKLKELIARFPDREKHIINTEEFDRVKARLPESKCTREKNQPIRRQ
jgi:predicted Zn-dependent protease